MKVLEGFEWEQFVKCTIAMTNTGLKPHPGMAREYVDDFLEGAISETDHDSIWKGFHLRRISVLRILRQGAISLPRDFLRLYIVHRRYARARQIRRRRRWEVEVLWSVSSNIIVCIYPFVL